MNMVGAASSEVVVDGVVVEMERTKDDEGVLGTNACPTERMAVKTIAADMRTIVYYIYVSNNCSLQ